MQNLLVVDFQYRHEGFLRHFNAADLLHPFLTFLLLLKEFPFTGDVTAVTLGKNVLRIALTVSRATTLVPTEA